MIKSKKHLEDYLSSIILIEMLQIKPFKKNSFKLKEPIKYSSMFLKEIHMISLANKVSNKSKKDLNLKEVISELIWVSLYLHSILEVKPFIALEEDKFVNIVKVQETLQELYILVQSVMEVEKWSEKSKLKIQLNKYKWNVNNVKVAVMLVNINAQFVMDKKLYLNPETYILKLKKVWEPVIKSYLKDNLNKALNSTQEMFI